MTIPRSRESWTTAFFAAAACSWMPHWACHYYRLETDSVFAVGTWSFSVVDSAIALGVYSALVLLNIAAAAVARIRPLAAILTGTLHLAFAALHAWRLTDPFEFTVLGYPWSQAASLREVVIVGGFGALALGLGLRGLSRKAFSAF